MTKRLDQRLRIVVSRQRTLGVEILFLVKRWNDDPAAPGAREFGMREFCIHHQPGKSSVPIVKRGMSEFPKGIEDRLGDPFGRACGKLYSFRCLPRRLPGKIRF